MRIRKTVFVVVAGASAEMGLPVGDSFQDEIAKALDMQSGSGGHTAGDPDIDRVLLRDSKLRGKDPNEAFQACRRVAQGVRLSISIDNYMDNHRDDVALQLAGKLAIAKTIMSAERACPLYASRLRDGGF